MPYSAVGSVGGAAAFTSGTGLSLGIGADITAGDTLLLFITGNNVGTTDADHNEVSSCQDSKSNTYVKLKEWTNGQGTSAAGATTSLWRSRLTNQLNLLDSDTISATFANSILDRCMLVHRFTGGSSALNVHDSDVAVVDGANGFGSKTFAGLASAETLWVGCYGKEANSTSALTVSSGFTSVGVNRSRNSADAMLIRGEFRISTTTGETLSPTFAVSGDAASVFVALREGAPPGGGTGQPTVRRFGMTQHGIYAPIGIEGLRISRAA